MIIHTGSPKNYLLLEGSNSIERPLHHLTAIPLRYFSTGVLKVLNIPIENTVIQVYLSKGKVFQQQFYLSWYYAHVLQNLLIIFISFYIFNKLVNPSLLKTFIFYILFYLPVLGREVLSPDMSLWIPLSILLNFVILNNYQNESKRKKIFWLVSLLFFYTRFLSSIIYSLGFCCKINFKKQINLLKLSKGVFINSLYFLGSFLILSDIKITQPGLTWVKMLVPELLSGNLDVY